MSAPLDAAPGAVAGPAARSARSTGSVRASIVWLGVERIATTVVVFVSNVVVIRYLGAERFGHLAFFQVLLFLLSIVTDFGLRRIFLSLGRARALPLVVRATVRLKSALALLLCAGLAAAVLAGSLPAEYLLLLAVVVAAPLDVHLYRLEACLRNDLLARLRIGLALLMALLRVALCWAEQDLMVIAATYVAPPLLLNLMLAALARRLPEQGPGRGGARQRAVQGHVLRRALWGFGAVLILQLGLRVDQLLLGHLGGAQALGWYAAAYKFVEQVTLLVSMVLGVLLPALSRRSEADTRALLQSIYFGTLVASLALAGVLGSGAHWIVAAAYGPEFAPAAEVLVILALGLPGVALALSGTLYYSLFGADAQLMLRALAGLAVALVANLLLIPRYGAAGAAWAGVLSQSFIAFGVDALAPATRANNILKWRALAALLRWREYHRLLDQVRRAESIA